MIFCARVLLYVFLMNSIEEFLEDDHKKLIARREAHERKAEVAT